MDSHLHSAMRLHLDLACVKLYNNEAELNITKAKLNDAHIKLNETEEKLEATRKVVEKLETRIFIWKINKFSVAKRDAIDSVPFYTDRTERFGYKLKLRILPNRNDFYNNYLVAIVVMKGEYDAILPWPFKMKVKFTFIDQSEDPIKRNNITRLSNYFNSKAFARPVEDENEEFSCFHLSHFLLYGRHCLANDTLFIQVEVSPP